MIRSSLSYFSLLALFSVGFGCRQPGPEKRETPVSSRSADPKSERQPGDSVMLSQKKFTFTDPACKGKPCATIAFDLPRSGVFTRLDSVIDSAAVAGWGRYGVSIPDFSQSTFRNWHEEASEYDDEPGTRSSANLPNNLLTRGTVLFNRQGLLSVRFDLENKENDQLVSYECAFLNLNTKTAKPLTIPDLLKPNTTDQFIAVAEEAFYSKYRFRLNAELEGCQLRFDRCKFILPEYFSFTESALVLEFKPNELGPAWMGNPPIVVPFAQIQDLINPAGPLAWAIDKKPRPKGLKEKWKNRKK